MSEKGEGRTETRQCKPDSERVRGMRRRSQSPEPAPRESDGGGWAGLTAGSLRTWCPSAGRLSPPVRGRRLSPRGLCLDVPTARLAPTFPPTAGTAPQTPVSASSRPSCSLSLSSSTLRLHEVGTCLRPIPGASRPLGKCLWNEWLHSENTLKAVSIVSSQSPVFLCCFFNKRLTFPTSILPVVPLRDEGWGVRE